VIDVVCHLLRHKGEMCQRDGKRAEVILGRLKERLESLKIEQLEVELGLMMGELTIQGGK
jgi:hypothetical protein